MLVSFLCITPTLWTALPSSFLFVCFLCLKHLLRAKLWSRGFTRHGNVKINNTWSFIFKIYHLSGKKSLGNKPITLCIRYRGEKTVSSSMGEKPWQGRSERISMWPDPWKLRERVIWAQVGPGENANTFKELLLRTEA